MKQDDFFAYTHILLQVRKQKINEYHCKHTNCCGICDRFYPCLFSILDEIKAHAETQRKEGIISEEEYKNK